MRTLLDLRGLSILAYKGGSPEQFTVDSTGKQIPTAAAGVKTFINRTLLPILEKMAPIDIIGVLEGSNHNARRRTLLESYKAKERLEDPVAQEQEDLCGQHIQKLLMALGCALVKTPYAEADDTLAYLCQNLKGGKIVHTVDKDLTVLHSRNTAIILRGEHCTSFEGMNFEEGVSPKMVTLYKSIVGDKSDNYPGVTGLGEVAWNNLVKTYGYDGMLQLLECVEACEFGPILESLKASPDKLLHKLYDNREQWRTSFLLAQLHPEWCETAFAGKSTRPVWAKRVPTIERLAKTLEVIGIPEMLPTFKKWMVQRIGIDTNSTVNMDSMFKAMRDSPLVAFDYESFDKNMFPSFRETNKDFVDVLSQVITGISFGFGANLQYSVYIPFRHRDTHNFPIEKLPEFLKAVDTVGQKAELVAQNATFEMCLSKTNLDYDFNRLVLDTAIMAKYVDEEEPNGLKHMSKRVLNYDQIAYKDVVKPGEDMRDLSLAEVLVYGCDDSITTAHLAVLYRLIMESEGTWDFYVENEPYFDKEMLKSYIKGVVIDFDELHKQAQEDSETSIKTMKELRALLEEHCSEINEEGYKTLWEEVSVYERTKILQKHEEEGTEINLVQLEERMEELRVETRQACKYNALTPARIERAMKMFSMVSRHLSLPGIRSVKPEYLQKFVKGIREQSAAQEVPLTELQEKFLGLLLGDHLDLYDFCLARMEEDEELWEGDELNIGSPKQMAQLFYGKMGLPINLRNIDKNKVSPNKRSVWDLEQAPSTDILAIETWMAELKEEDWRHQVLKKVKLLRAIKTKFGLYYKPYPRFRRPDDGRVHPGIKNCGTITKRPSGTSPNFLQLSKKDEARFRRVVTVEEGYVVVSIDFVQQELVVLAGLADDKNLRSCYQGDNKRDVHSMTGTSILNLQLAKMGKKLMSYEEFHEAQQDKKTVAHVIRKKGAKTTNFLMVYGGSAPGLARKAVVPQETAEMWQGAFFATYPGVERYQDRMVSLVRRHGFVKTIYGTRRHLNGAFSANKAVAAACERQGINAPIQGSCADLLKIVFRKMVQANLTERLRSYVIAPVYDEIIAAVPREFVYQWCNELADMMEMELPGLNISLSTSVSIGINAGDQKELGTRPTEEMINEELERIFR